MDAKIKVVVRKRPLTRREVERGDTDILETLDDSRVILLEPKVRVDLTRYVEEHSFTFDDAFGASDSNADVYTQCIRPLVDVAVDRHCHATCFAYGCTGSGKTYTMMGDWRDDGSGVKGLYALAATDLFAKIARGAKETTGVAVSFYEIYMGKLYDLLNERALVHARENGKQKVVIAGLTEQRVATAAELLQTVGQGLLVRRSGSTSANCDSSRSHAVLQILLKNVEQEKEGRSVHSALKYSSIWHILFDSRRL
jgi:kinesin family protein 2/24